MRRLVVDPRTKGFHLNLEAWVSTWLWQPRTSNTTSREGRTAARLASSARVMPPGTFVDPMRRMLGTPCFALWRFKPALGQCWRVSRFNSEGRRRLVLALPVHRAALCCWATFLVELMLPEASQTSATFLILGAGRAIRRTTCRHKSTTSAQITQNMAVSLHLWSTFLRDTPPRNICQLHEDSCKPRSLLPTHTHTTAPSSLPLDRSTADQRRRCVKRSLRS